MAILIHDPPSTPPTPPCDAPDQSVFEPLVKNYYNAKFWVASSNIAQVMAILVHDPPLRPLNPPRLILVLVYGDQFVLWWPFRFLAAILIFTFSQVLNF